MKCFSFLLAFLALASTSYGFQTGANANAGGEGKGVANGPWITSLAVEASGQSVLVTTAEGLLLRPGSVARVSLADPTMGTKLYDHGTSAWKVIIAPEANLAISGDYKGELLRSDLANPQTPAALEAKPRWSRAMLSIGDGKVLAGTEDGKMLLLNLPAGNVEKQWDAHASAIFSIALSPDKNIVATSSGDGIVKLWNLADGAELRTIKVATSAVWSVAFSQDGSQLITGDADRRLNLYETATGKLRMTLQVLPDWITSLVVLPGDTIAAGCLNGSVYIYDLPALRKVARLEGPGSGIWALGLTVDGSRLVLGTRKHGVALLPLESLPGQVAAARAEAAAEQPPAPR